MNPLTPFMFAISDAIYDHQFRASLTDEEWRALVEFINVFLERFRFAREYSTGGKT